jgi:hypothetical protein
MDDTSQGLRQIAYLMVVQRGDEDRLRFLQSSFRDKPVHVMFDRRVGERRREGPPAGVERRRQDRRATPPPSWGTLGFLVARHTPVTAGT